MSEEPITSIPSSVPTLSICSCDSVTSCTSLSVTTVLPVCFIGESSEVEPVPEVKVIGSVGVPDLAMVTD